ncbi:hypothetical protein N8E89_25085 (plasmid) [Phyllobacterium sp. A18/5-2]|uniref:hypothetical protein n=1 Tax=Phyllobacterium sp. A18/5-2 TaxID=2978392 RepID=UPI0021C901CB|nr:hypothetical protein [Phyllobacterium sp. A18/5-2]UXN66407.1 hypothetical protein N8E89_25085 [Phyllobacterium sp. A18/5-2]
MERIKNVIREYQEIAERLEAGKDRVYRKSRSGEDEDISVQTADHYRRLLTHYTEIVERNEAIKTQPGKKQADKKR